MDANWIVLWVFLFVYGISTVMFCFMMSVFFSRTKVAILTSAIVWIALYMPFWLSGASMPPMLTCIFSNSAMAHGFVLILQFEAIQDGIQWSDMWNKPTAETDLTIGSTICFMLGTSFVYLLIALYFEQIFSAKWKTSEKWYFPFSKNFWCSTSVDKRAESNPMISNANFETDSETNRVGIRIQNLCKKYGKVEAINDVTLNVLANNITVLIGHSGAGKTTLISMLIGILKPTSGTVIINGHNIRKNIKKARSSMGICLQENFLFPDLTVREHIDFYSSLKGVPKKDIINEVKKYVQQLDLNEEIDKRVYSMSIQSKRKLSVAIALCGDSKVVLCDEPMSGMDPSARQLVWNLLQREKIGRTIILTTNFMDEANVLSDRIAIMNEGELQCYGSPAFLRNRLGTGYLLVCVMKDGYNPDAVTHALREFIPGIDIHTNIPNELSYRLFDKHTEIFENIFRALEKAKEDLKINDFRIMLITLEEVAFKMASGAMIPIMSEMNDSNDTAVSRLDDLTGKSLPLLTGFRLHVNQWLAMILKRYHRWMSNLMKALLRALLSVIIIIILVLSIRPFFDKPPKISLELIEYGKTVTMLQSPAAIDDPVIEK